MKTQEEILKKIEDVKEDDFFGAMRNDLVKFLTYENAKHFLVEGVTETDWKVAENTPESIKAEAINYLPFAWEKANSCRGLSANRSMDHMRAYLFLLGDEELEKRFADTPYEHYGKEKLIVVSEAVGFDWKSVDDGVRTNTDS